MAGSAAWHRGHRDGFALGLEYGDDDDPAILYPPMPQFSSEAEEAAYLDGHCSGYVDGAFEAERRRQGITTH